MCFRENQHFQIREDDHYRKNQHSSRVQEAHLTINTDIILFENVASAKKCHYRKKNFFT